MSSVPLKCAEEHEKQVTSEKDGDHIQTISTFRRVLPQVLNLIKIDFVRNQNVRFSLV